MKYTIVVILLIICVLAGAAVFFYWQNLRGVWPAIHKAPLDIGTVLPPVLPDVGVPPDVEPPSPVVDPGFVQTGPLRHPSDFNIQVLTDNVPGARVLARGPNGDLWVSQRSLGQISVVGVNESFGSGGLGVGDVTVRYENLNNPHGIVFDPTDPSILFIAEEDAISKVNVLDETSVPEKIIELPKGGRHVTRTIKFGPDDMLYVSVGSTCDVCVEDDERVGTISRMNRDGSAFEVYAEGLRNSVFFDWNPVDGALWATEMGRDLLGDNLPPDEVNIIKEGRHYGWPYCYGGNVRDGQFDKSPDTQSFCNNAEPAYIDLQAHSAPLGLAFIPEEGWPERLWYDLLVAYHGSWNRTEPTGYKIVRFEVDEFGVVHGREDFVSGWLTDDGKALGRPVDILVSPGGVIYISDDKAGVIYRMTYAAQHESFYDELRTISIENGDSISPGLFITGEARGTWFFEAEFPIFVEDAHGKRLGWKSAFAQDEWMTEDFVSFQSGPISFTPPETDTGFIVFKKSNPSGLPQFDKSLRIAVRFGSHDGCIVSGCSNELCGEEELYSTCEYKNEYACYQSAQCERQDDGDCGWTESEELIQCLNQSNN